MKIKLRNHAHDKIHNNFEEFLVLNIQDHGYQTYFVTACCLILKAEK